MFPAGEWIIFYSTFGGAWGGFGGGPLPSISRAYSCRMVALPDQNVCMAPHPQPTQGQVPPGNMAALTKETSPIPSLTPQTSVPLLFHHSCHCYYVIFLTRPSCLREQHCFSADSPECDVCISCSFCRHKAAPEVAPLCVSQPCASCVVQAEVLALVVASCPGRLLRGGPSWFCSGGVAGRYAARCSMHPAVLEITCCTAPPVETMVR